ncbi:hypothetical protein LSM04_000244 [Trypanosoma melophagium]|uniref:uncharacterized protein n=1 Tax=Trypanosoma melophagium TaxID=715481 RepID=UPI00351AAC7E|nr:hypothetical protein LSM04_000244 [Trypanosoma melophagium]
MEEGFDRYTFQFAELSGKADFCAFGKVTRDFLHGFRQSKHYEVMLSAFLHRLFEDPELISPANLKSLENALVERANTLLSEERARDKDRLVKGRKPVYELQQESEESEEEEPVITEEELHRQEEERLEREMREEERLAAREEERRRNEEVLRARARQVDTKAMEEMLQNAVVLNPGHLKPKMGGKQQQQQKKQVTEEELREMESQVAVLMKEKERLQTVLQTSEEELPAKLTEAKEELATAEAKVNSHDGATASKKAPMQPKQINARAAELKQKLSKLTVERTRLALQMKAEPHPLREELLSVLQSRDEAQLKLDA